MSSLSCQPAYKARPEIRERQSMIFIPPIRTSSGETDASRQSTSLPVLFLSVQPILSRDAEEVLTYDALRWAWCSVNTRSVFLSRPPNHFLSGQDVYALAPFLDLLNHRPDVQVSASFNHVNACYEIRTVAGIQRYQQAFINYGSHDNQRLLIEYGFVAPGNPNSVVYVDADLLQQVLQGALDRSVDQKMKFLEKTISPII
ncbi:unnamed protein product [Boreogadus saida]